VAATVATGLGTGPWGGPSTGPSADSDSLNQLYVIYSDIANYDIHLKTNNPNVNATPWATDILLAGGSGLIHNTANRCHFGNLAVVGDVLYIAFSDIDSNDIYVAKCSNIDACDVASNWTWLDGTNSGSAELVASASTNPYGNMAVESSTSVVLIYVTDHNFAVVKCSYWNGSSWAVSSDLEPTRALAYQPIVRFDSSGYIHATYLASDGSTNNWINYTKSSNPRSVSSFPSPISLMNAINITRKNLGLIVTTNGKIFACGWGSTGGIKYNIYNGSSWTEGTSGALLASTAVVNFRVTMLEDLSGDVKGWFTNNTDFKRVDVDMAGYSVAVVTETPPAGAGNHAGGTTQSQVNNDVFFYFNGTALYLEGAMPGVGILLLTT